MPDLTPNTPNPEDDAFRLPSWMRRELESLLRLAPFTEAEMTAFTNFVAERVEEDDGWIYDPREDCGLEDMAAELRADLGELDGGLGEIAAELLGDDEAGEEWKGPKKRNQFLHPSIESYLLATSEGGLRISRHTGTSFKSNPDDSVEFEVVLARPKNPDPGRKLAHLFGRSKTIRFEGERAQEFFQRLEERRG